MDQVEPPTFHEKVIPMLTTTRPRHHAAVRRLRLPTVRAREPHPERRCPGGRCVARRRQGNEPEDAAPSAGWRPRRLTAPYVLSGGLRTQRGSWLWLGATGKGRLTTNGVRQMPKGDEIVRALIAQCPPLRVRSGT